MLAMGAKKANSTKASNGATSSRAVRRRRRSSRRSARASSGVSIGKASTAVLLQQPLIELFAEAFTVVGPEHTVYLNAFIHVGAGQVGKHVFVDQGKR